MMNEQNVIDWLHKHFLKQWKAMTDLNRKFLSHEQVSADKRVITFPFIPVEADGYTLQTFTSFILKYLFQSKLNSFIILIKGQNDSILWAGLQKVENFTFTELIDLKNNRQDLKSFKNLDNPQEQLKYLKDFLEKTGITPNLNFYLLLDIQVVLKFKEILENHANLLDFYSKIWDLMTNHFMSKTIQFYPEPLIFKFFRRLTTKTFTFNAKEFKQLFGNLLPPQNIIINSLDMDILSSIIIVTKPNFLEVQFPDYDLLNKQLERHRQNPNKGLQYLNKIIKKTIPVLINQQKTEANIAITVTDDFWTKLRDIMKKYSFEYMLDKLLEFSQESEEEWTIEKKILLFKRWGKSFMRFQLDQLIPTQPTSIISSVLRFLNEVQTRFMWFIVNDSLELLYVLGTDFEEGQFRRVYMISDQKLFQLYNSAPDKVLAIKKAHNYFAEHDTWVNQIIAITAQDLNLLISFLPRLTSVKESLKYLNIIENIITYRMFCYPPNFFADLISRKGATYFFKNIWFPMIVSNL